MLPNPTIAFRKRRCAQAGGNCEADFAEPCAQCPNGHWGPMMCGGLYDPPSPGESSPTMASMVKSAAESAKKWVTSGLQLADEEALQERLKACRECEFWNPKGFRGTGRCMKCGCSTWAKLRMATEKCPIDKWGPVSHTTNKP